VSTTDYGDNPDRLVRAVLHELVPGTSKNIPREPDWVFSPGMDPESVHLSPRRKRRRRVPWWVKWGAVLTFAALIFRKAVAFAAISALAAGLHLIGVNVHLPHVKLMWPWQSISAGTASNTDLGPLVLNKVEAITTPALGTTHFNFTFTHKESKNVGPWPCWYSETFQAAASASATVNLSPGPAWWAPATGHYLLQVLSRPASGRQGQVTVQMTLPAPQLPQTVHNVSVDNTQSHVIDTQHSWSYPGFGCGVLLKPQFSPAVMYSLAQTMAFQQARTQPGVTRPLIAAAKTAATNIVRGFIQATLNAFGYTLAEFNINWASSPN